MSFTSICVGLSPAIGILFCLLPGPIFVLYIVIYASCMVKIINRIKFGQFEAWKLSINIYIRQWKNWLMSTVGLEPTQILVKQILVMIKSYIFSTRPSIIWRKSLKCSTKPWNTVPYALRNWRKNENTVSYLQGEIVCNKIYSEPLMYAFSPSEGLVESIFKFIQSPLGILCFFLDFLCCYWPPKGDATMVENNTISAT